MNCEMCGEKIVLHYQIRNDVLVCIPCMQIINQVFLDALSPVAKRRAARRERNARIHKARAH